MNNQHRLIRRNPVLILALLSICFLYAVFQAQIFSTIKYLWHSADVNGSYVSSAPQFSSHSKKNTCSLGNLMYGEYCITSPYEKELKNTSNVGLVTLCTQATVGYLHHVTVLCHRWRAPISVAVYSPADDYVAARFTVDLLRHCDSCIRYWVNWHFFFPNQRMPDISDRQLTTNCSSIAHFTEAKRRSRGVYPINVGRNVARSLTHTPYVFSIDIELYPSLNIPSKFERMLRSQVTSNDNKVWVFPVFEVAKEVTAPHTKLQLRNLFKEKQAISFHQFRCTLCHRIPNVTQWIFKVKENTSELEDSLEPLKVWSTVKRNWHFKLQNWEPFFIGTNKDPEFDIRLSWEGKGDKMPMAYEMCMRDYDFNIIENAFLVHAPGINKYNATKERIRQKYVKQNKAVIKNIKYDMKKKYGYSKLC